MESAKNLSANYSAAMAELMLNNQVNNIPKLETTPDMLSKYLYPTMIILPIVIVVILILASRAHLAIKIISIVLLVLVIVVYHLQQNNIDVLNFIQPRVNDVPYKK